MTMDIGQKVGSLAAYYAPVQGIISYASAQAVRIEERLWEWPTRRDPAAHSFNYRISGVYGYANSGDPSKTFVRYKLASEDPYRGMGRERRVRHAGARVVDALIEDVQNHLKSDDARKAQTQYSFHISQCEEVGLDTEKIKSLSVPIVDAYITTAVHHIGKKSSTHSSISFHFCAMFAKDAGWTEERLAGLYDRIISIHAEHGVEYLKKEHVDAAQDIYRRGKHFLDEFGGNKDILKGFAVSLFNYYAREAHAVLNRSFSNPEARGSMQESLKVMWPSVNMKKILDGGLIDDAGELRRLQRRMAAQMTDIVIKEIPEEYRVPIKLQ